MRRSNHTDDEILHLLQEAASGVPIAVICQTAHISVRTFYRWRRQLGGMPPAAVRRLRALERENQQLRQLVARLKESNPGGGWGGWVEGGSQAPAPYGERDGGQRPNARSRLATGGSGRHRGTGASAGPYASLRAGRN